MIWLAYISILFLTNQLVNTMVNLFFRQKLKAADSPEPRMISVLIPARNEEENIAVILSDLQKIRDENIEIIVCDDQSSDETARVVGEYALTDRRVKLLQSDTLPEGWLGKNHACYQLANKAKGRYYLFVDADVRLYGNIIIDAVAYLNRYNLGLLSVFPTQIQANLSEKVTVPVMNYILLTLLPLILVRISPYAAHAAANGQFMLFDAKTYNKLNPHLMFKDSPVEDISISRFYKNQRIKIACLTGEKRIACRMYRSYTQSLKGFSKNVFMFFGDIPLLAFLFWILAALGFVPVMLSIPDYMPFYLAGVILTQILYSYTSRQNIFLNIMFFPAHLIFLMLIMVNGIFVRTSKVYSWKGRNIY